MQLDLDKHADDRHRRIDLTRMRRNRAKMAPLNRGTFERVTKHALTVRPSYRVITLINP